MKNVRELEVTNKKVLVRCDFDVPLDEQGEMLDDFRIKESLPTIQYLVENKAMVILMGHLGRPEGVVVESLRLTPIRKKLEEYLQSNVMQLSDCIGPEVDDAVSSMKPGEIILLENVRFHKEETENDKAFAKKLASLGNLYVNDAFADSHRTHASIVGICEFLPSVAGLTLQKEVEVLSNVIESPKAPLVVIIGGNKVEGTKAKLISTFSESALAVIVGGLIQKEIIENSIPIAHPEKILGPVDSLDAPDISENTAAIFREKILMAKMIVWNGPFGKFEDARYKKGTLAIAQAIIESGAYSVVGGGQTVEFLHREGILSKFSAVVTGGGAMLTFLSGEELPGLKALK